MPRKLAWTTCTGVPCERVAQLHMFWADEEFHLPAIACQAQGRCIGDFAQFSGDTGIMEFTTEEMSQPYELGDKARAWAPYDLVWRGILDDLALVDDRQGISETQRFFLIVGHQDGGDASLHENGLHFFA